MQLGVKVLNKDKDPFKKLALTIWITTIFTSHFPLIYTSAAMIEEWPFRLTVWPSCGSTAFLRFVTQDKMDGWSVIVPVAEITCRASYPYTYISCVAMAWFWCLVHRIPAP